MKVGIFGGTGFIGNEINNYLSQKNHDIVIFTRNPKKSNQKKWNPQACDGWETELNNLDIIINLCGEGIADWPWTKKRKQALYDSRIQPTKTIVNAIQECKTPPSLLINASAIGIYKASDSLETAPIYTESDIPGNGFLENLCNDWETEAMKASTTCRVCTLRIGMVIGKKGLLQKLMIPFKCGLGHYFGKGLTPFSWIHCKDICRIVSFIMSQKSLSGPINAVSPSPVTFKVFTKTLGQVLNRPVFISVPSFCLSLLGNMGDLFLKGCAVKPSVLLKKGFEFRYTKLKSALEDWNR